MKAASKKITISTNLWTAATLNNYKENVSYDANGNILKYQRYSDAIPMDSLTYNYYSATNRLNYIKDTVADIRHTTDLDNQGSGNYKYDDIGNLTKDVKENIDTIYWNVYGKITQINKHNSDTIRYTYDASGNRISEIVSKYSSGTKRETWYVRDAGGNVMSVYTKGDAGINSGALSQTEIYLYGSSRLGVMKPNINVQSIAPLTKIYLHALGWGTFGNFTRGTKFFELSNHLGNVLVTVSDKKKALSDNGTTISKYDADVVSAQDYYPFGMLQSGRNVSAANYRYGFNGKENDNDVKGTGNQQDYGLRIYDPRVGRFFSIDPLFQDYPWNSTYAFAENDVIRNIDLDGAEKLPYIQRFQTNTGNWTDYVGAVNNGVINLLNLIPETWNSGVETYQSLRRGTYGQDLKRDIKQLGSNLKQTAKNSWNYTVNTPLKTQFTDALSPNSIELYSTLYFGSKMPVGGSGKGNLLKPLNKAVTNSESLTTTAAANAGRLTIPQGLTAEEFQVMSQRIVNRVGNISEDIVVQGSRASGTATAVSDIDIAIKVNSKQFDELITQSFGNPNVGSAKWKTMQNAIETGKIQSGEAGLRNLRQNLEKLLGMDVDISIIKQGGQFDNGAQIPVAGVKTN